MNGSREAGQAAFVAEDGGLAPVAKVALGEHPVIPA
jgi:hypothetical protein